MLGARKLFETRIALGFLYLLIIASGCGDSEKTSPEEGGPQHDGDTGCHLWDGFSSDQCLDYDHNESCIFYVDQTAKEPGNGLSWKTAFASIQQGIDAAHCAAIQSDRCNPWEVWVAKGTYYIYQNCREDTLRLRPFVTVLGGFKGNEQHSSERDYQENETVLDGRNELHGEESVLHVVLGADYATLDGFTITGGRADREGEMIENTGGGLLAFYQSPRVTNCIFQDNMAISGGAMAIFEGSPLISNCIFKNNESLWGGGAVIVNRGEATFVDCEFRHNETLNYGGALFSVQSHLTIDNSEFVANTSQYFGGGMYIASSRKGLISRTTIDGNIADGVGSIGGGIYFQNCSMRVTDSTISENFARSSGGGFGVVLSELQIIACKFADNRAAQVGGGAFFSIQSRNTIDKCRFTGNIAEDSTGGAIHTQIDFSHVRNSVFFDNEGDQGAALFVTGSTVTHCSIAGNRANLGSGGIFLSSKESSLINSIVWGNTPYDVGYWALTSPAQVVHSAVGPYIEEGDGNIYEDPLFVNLAEGNLKLRKQSPCIDAADSTQTFETDIEGHRRIDSPEHQDHPSEYADMGAYEYVP